MKKLNAAFEKIESIIIALCALCLIGIITIIIYQVAARALNISTSGTEELARYCYVLFVFLLWPVAAHRGQDLRISVFTDMLPVKVRTKLMGVYTVIMAAFCLVFCYSILLNIQNSAKNNMVLPSNTWLPLAVIQGIVMFGFVMTLIANVLRAVQLFAGEVTVYTQNEENEFIMEQEAARVAAEEERGAGK